MTIEQAGLAGVWAKLNGRRTNHLNRQIECAELTIPALLPKEHTNEDVQLPTPYQSLGARAVNNLASKLVLSLFPPNSPFFKFDLDAVVRERLKAELGEKGLKEKITSKFVVIEQDITRYFESEAMRPQLYRALRLLIVTGNVLLELPDDGPIKAFRLDKYVVRRNPSGQPVHIVLKEMIDPDEVPEGIDRNQEDKKEGDGSKPIELYTEAKWDYDDKKWHIKQECLGQLVPDSEGAYKKDECPFLALTWTLADGENYGRGHVEEYLGDFISLDGLSQSLLEGAAIAAMVKFLVNPSGQTNVEDLKKTRNGGFCAGREGDVVPVRLEKFADFRTAYDQSNTIEGRLSRAFLLNESVQRDAERVTAEEIRYMAQELDDAIGGIYSVLSLELQFPFLRRLMFRLRKRKGLKLPADVQPTIITGFEALGRGHELRKLRTALEYLQPFGPEVLSMYIKVENYIQRVFNAVGVDTDGLVPTSEEIEAAKKQQQQKEIVQQLGPEAMKMLQGMQQAKGQQNG